MMYGKFAILICSFIFFQKPSLAQNGKLTKAEKKQEQKNIDSLFIVYSLPITVTNVKEFSNMQLKDSIVAIFKNKKYQCPSPAIVKNLIVEKMFDFLPSPITEKERYNETMEKVAKDKNYYFTLMELADPFLQSIELSLGIDTLGFSFINVKRQNFPNGRKSREWTFKYDESEPINNLAVRIIEVLANTKSPQ